MTHERSRFRSTNLSDAYVAFDLVHASFDGDGTAADAQLARSLASRGAHKRRSALLPRSFRRADERLRLDDAGRA
jgi:hypothetical protein